MEESFKMIKKKKPEQIFLILGSIFISITIFLMPLNYVPDEATHATYAWTTFHAQQPDSITWVGAIPHSGKIEKQEYKKIFTKKIDLSKEKYQLNFKIKKIQHIPVIIGLFLGSIIYPSIGVMLTLGRIFNALFYIVSFYYIIKYMKFGKYALTFIGLLPIMVQQMASLSYDVPNFLAISFFFAVVSNLVVNKSISSKSFLSLFLTTLCLYLTKKNNIILLILLPFIDIEFPIRLQILNVFKKKFKTIYLHKRRIIIPLALIIVMFLFIFYFKNKGGITHFIQILLNTLLNVNLNEHINNILTVGMFGYIGHFDMQFPLWLIFIDISILTILFMAGNDTDQEMHFPKSYCLASGLMFPLQVLIIISGMYFAWTPLVLGENANISVGAQGRYFTPFLIYLSPLFIGLNSNFQIKLTRKSLNNILITTVLLNLLLMIYLITILYWFPDIQGEWLINLRK